MLITTEHRVSAAAKPDHFTTAYKLLTVGYSVVPSGGGAKGKTPLVDWKEYQERLPTEDELYGWQERLSPQIWGVVTGQISGVVVFDADTPEMREELESWGLEAHISTPRGGAHFYFRHPGFPVKTMAGLLPGLDVRGDGGFCNIVGDNYAIQRLPTHDNLYPWEQLPGQIREAMNDAKSAPHVAIVKGNLIPEGQRNAVLTSIAGAMRRRGISEAALLAALHIENQGRCTPPLPDEEVQRIVQSICRYDPGPPLGVMATPHKHPQASASWPEPLADEAFHGLAGDVVKTIDPHTEADPAAILTNFLTSFGSAVGPIPRAIAEADKHGCNLFVVQVGDTSKGRKGSGYSHVRELFSLVDPTWTSNCIVSGLASGEGVVWGVRDSVQKLVKGEATIVDEGIADKRLLVYEAEFSAPLKVAAREGNTLSATLRQAWDSGSLRILSKNSPTKATGAHISILGHVTKDELLRYLNDTEAGNGFANRFLWVCVSRSKVLPEGGGRPDYGSIVPSLHAALERARKLGELKRDAYARKIWAEVYPELSEGKPGLFGAVTARAEAQVLRLSVLYAALDGDSQIRSHHVMAALAVWDYCEASARYIFGDKLGDPVADRILGMLQQNPEGLNRTKIYELFSKHTPAARIEQALKLLQTTGRAQRETMDTGGRPVEVWLAA